MERGCSPFWSRAKTVSLSRAVAERLRNLGEWKGDLGAEFRAMVVPPSQLDSPTARHCALAGSITHEGHCWGLELAPWNSQACQSPVIPGHLQGLPLPGFAGLAQLAGKRQQGNFQNEMFS